jgi:hypothetical protein
MWGQIDGKAKIVVAKEVLSGLLANAPEGSRPDCAPGWGGTLSLSSGVFHRTQLRPAALAWWRASSTKARSSSASEPSSRKRPTPTLHPQRIPAPHPG